MNDKRDQSDLLAEVDGIETEICRLEMSLTAHGKAVPPRPTVPKDDLLHAVDLLSGHRSVLTTSVSLARTQRVSQVPILSPGGSPGPADMAPVAAPANPSSTTMTATEKILARKGVTTLSQLAGTGSRQKSKSGGATNEGAAPAASATSVDPQLVHAVSVVMKKLQPEQTATDRVLAAEGCKTVDELTAKRAKQLNEKYTKR